MPAAENVRSYVVPVPTPGTPAKVVTSKQTVLSALVVALDSNTGYVAVGGVDGASASSPGQNGIRLAAGDSVPFGAIDLGDLRIDAAVAGEGVCVITEE